MSFIGKILSFTFTHAAQADLPTPTFASSAAFKTALDSQSAQLQTSVNNLIDALNSITPTSSGSENLGSAPISGVAGATAYAQLVDLKAQLQAAVIGTIPDNTLDYVKLNAATKDLVTEYGLARQILIDGNFDRWDRGTSFNPAAGAYLADPWYAVTASNATFSKQTASPPVGSSSYARVTFNVLGGFLSFAEAFLSEVCNMLKGKTISTSIQMRRDATYDGTYTILIEKNASADTSVGTWTTITSATFTPTTSWTTVKLENILVPSDANGLRIQIFQTGGTRPANSYVEFSQAQMNFGNIALPFQPRQPQEEKRLVDWTYEKQGLGLSGYVLTATEVVVNLKYVKRANPTITLLSTTPAITANGGFVSGSGSTMAIYGSKDAYGAMVKVNGFTGLTLGQFVMVNQSDLFAIDANI